MAGHKRAAGQAWWQHRLYGLVIEEREAPPHVLPQRGQGRGSLHTGVKQMLKGYEAGVDLKPCPVCGSRMWWFDGQEWQCWTCQPCPTLLRLNSTRRHGRCPLAPNQVDSKRLSWSAI